MLGSPCALRRWVGGAGRSGCVAVESAGGMEVLGKPAGFAGVLIKPITKDALYAALALQ